MGQSKERLPFLLPCQAEGPMQLCDGLCSFVKALLLPMPQIHHWLKASRSLETAPGFCSEASQAGDTFH